MRIIAKKEEGRHPGSPFVLEEGKNLGNTVQRAILRARRERRRGVIVRAFTTSGGAKREKAILFISPFGDVQEVMAPAMRTKFGEFVVEQVLDEAERFGLKVAQQRPAGRLMMWWANFQAPAVRKAA